MFNRKELKKSAQRNLKSHYLFFVIVVLIGMLIGSFENSALNIVNFRTDNDSNMAIALSRIADGDVEGAIDATTDNYRTIAEYGTSLDTISVDKEIEDFKTKAIKMLDDFSQGYFIHTLFSALVSITGSNTSAKVLLVIVSLIFLFLKTMFLANVFSVICARFFLQGRTYDRFTGSALMHLVGLRHWNKVAFSMIRVSIYKFLWMFTIAGAFIKRYSYFLVPFILAERSDISGKDAINLSRKMMNGHKWECFVLDLSFIGWYLLNIATFGIADMLFVMPYRTSVYAEYYVYIRNLSKEANIEMTDRLDDVYLYEKAPIELIDKAYASVAALKEEPEIEIPKISKFKEFLAKNFGFVFFYDEYEETYRGKLARSLSIRNYEKAVAGEIYPEKLYPIEPPQKKIHLENVYFTRHYSLISLLLMFFSFAFVGWLWEVTIHIIEDARFVNRGVLHGPWLPIYGTGAMVILLLLNRLRTKPIAEFFVAMTLCGIVEYFTSWYLEVTMNGTKWWDYSDYFLNLNGRICAEGLLIFGVAGVAGVYFIAPILDNLFIKIPKKVAIVILVILIAVFVADNIYSSGNPNVGKGITDYAFSGIVTDIPRCEHLLHL